MPAMNGFSRPPQQGPPGHNPNIQLGSIGHNHHGSSTVGGVTSIGGVGGQLSVGVAMPNRQQGAGMQSIPNGHPPGGPSQMHNHLSVGARPSGGSNAFGSGGSSELPFSMSGGKIGSGASVGGHLGGPSLMSGGDSDLGGPPSEAQLSFGAEDFPTLGGGAPQHVPQPDQMPPPILGALGGGRLGQDFQMADSDFPSLGPGPKKSPAVLPQPSAVGVLGNHQEELHLNEQVVQNRGVPAAPGAAQQSSAGASQWGLVGLLNVIQMTSADLNTLALGTDLTTLGLNLNSTEPLYSTFASPWTDTPCQREPEFSVPMCYYMQPPTLKTGHIQKFQLETLFYIFYMLPKDTLQAVAASELHARDWKFHAELGMWFHQQPEAGGKGGFGRPATYVYFDVKVWERRSYVDANKNLEQGFLDEEALRMR